ncbi:HU domain-containing protein [Solitalea koreensis]|uniref:CCDC81-like prokaryotic HU domain-containing protein n=1 Tax=Solitalea koreensis TaxID=543615 RepID=A0A521D1S4_9SPHI|nr:hypothetical protein [Solitalea koreensis]SMO65634.1 hypothetical protein SAMN06265350_105141 [Solitalea koreensis]
METLKYLIDSFSTSDQVIVPDLGCFFVSRHELNHDKGAGIVVPPYISVLFNPYIANNDGVLERYISKEKNITLESAANDLQKFILKIKHELNHKGEFEIPRIGKLRTDKTGNITFTQQENSFINRSSFGLTSVPAKIHPQDRAQMAIEQKIKRNSGEKEESSVLKWLFISLAIIIITSLALLLAFQYYYNSKF